MTELVPGCVAFYLPQFHPTPENDRWWGPGFTEWHNVVRATPTFRGHRQPRLPADLGFYDLRLDETRRAQGSLARDHGVQALCYYHYWFMGHRPLHEPLDRMLVDELDPMPFLLCWVNESWTRTWTGRTGDTLIEQCYSTIDDENHIRWMLPVLEDPRYLTLDGRPIVLIYRASQLPDPQRTLSTWRAAARAAGFPDLHLCRVESFREERGDPRSLGFDAAVDFQPDWPNLPRPKRSLRGSRLFRRLLAGVQLPGPRRYRYRDVVEHMKRRPAPPYPRFPGVTSGWDNTPRRGRAATVIHPPGPLIYGDWLEHSLRRAAQEAPVGAVFVNAWNEWAEGAILEPDTWFGHAFLEATKSATSRWAGSDAQ